MPTIFLVEDNASDVELFRLALQEAAVDCDFVLFEDGGEIVDYLLKSEPALPERVPDLIVLDLNLPKRDGLEVLQVLRETAAFAEVPIVVLSSSSSARERAKLSAFQIRAFIVKSSVLEEYMKVGTIVRGLLEEAKRDLGQAAVAGQR